ncbi:hypothetical protein ACFPPF_09825 [Xenophilus aerolatus]|nr:hypothetical protein [Xenophilus aerolatus]
MMRQVGAGGRVAKTLYTFAACQPLLNMANRGEGMTLALGDSRAASPWRIIQTEALANGSVMVTLKSLTAFAIIPTLDYMQVAPEHRPAVAEAIERVLNSAFRETPTSVVDHCRAALTILLSRWLVQAGHERDSVFGLDLGDLAKRVEKLELYCVAKAAQIVALLHSRGKPNVQHAKGGRPPENGDDELALQSIGLIIREFGWAA